LAIDQNFENSIRLEKTFTKFLLPVFTLGPAFAGIYFLLGAKNLAVHMVLSLGVLFVPALFLFYKKMWSWLSAVVICNLSYTVLAMSMGLHYEGKAQFHLFTIILMVDFLSQILKSKKFLFMITVPVCTWIFLDLKLPLEHPEFLVDTYVYPKVIEVFESFTVVLVFSIYTYLHNFYLDTSRRRQIIQNEQIQQELSKALNEADQFFQMSLGFMVISDGKGHVVKANHSFCEAIGYSQMELQKMHIFDIIRVEDHEKSRLAISQLMERRELIGFENRFLTRSGKELNVLWSAAKDIKTGLVYSAGKDLTHLKKQMQDYEQLLNAMNISAILTVSDVNGAITSVNQHFLDLSGYRQDELVGRSHELLYFDEFDRDKFKTIMQHVQNGEVWSGEIVSRSKEGNLYFTNTVITPVKNHEGQIEKYLGIRIDQTKERQLQAVAEQQKNRAIQSSKLASLGEMSAGVAHEINNPLAIIQGCTEIIRRRHQEPQLIIKQIDTIEKSAHRIARIVMSLKKFSRTHNKSDYKTESLKSILEESLFLTHAKSTIHQTTIEMSIDTNAEILGDAVELEQVFINLIHNAIDVAKDSAQKWVRIYAFDEGSEVVVQIVDPGFGIEPQIAERLLEPFYTTKLNGEGTGLGLSITKGILDEHGAELRIKKREEHTCFEVRFSRTNEFASVA